MDPISEMLDDPEGFVKAQPKETQAKAVKKMNWVATQATVKVLRLVAPELDSIPDAKLFAMVDEDGGDESELLKKARKLALVGVKFVDPFGLPESTQ